MRLKLLEHPRQCYVGQPGFLIPTPDITMHPGEPELLDPFARIPQGRSKAFSFLIDRDSLVTIAHVRMQRGVMEAEQ